jgi:hypothetical protein
MMNKKEADDATRESIKREMAKPRMAKSARRAELNLEAERIPGQASTTVLGTVDKIIDSLGPNQPEKAQIAVAGADDRHRDLRIENTLIDGNGEEVRLKKRVPTLNLPLPLNQRSKRFSRFICGNHGRRR